MGNATGHSPAGAAGLGGGGAAAFGGAAGGAAACMIFRQLFMYIYTIL